MQPSLQSGLLSPSESFYPAQPSNRLELAWQKGFAALREFQAREKHCRVPRGHREGAFNLGTWVINQRNRKDTLSVERRRSLEAVGFDWTLLVRDSWEEGFSALKQFEARGRELQAAELGCEAAHEKAGNVHGMQAATRYHRICVGFLRECMGKGIRCAETVQGARKALPSSEVTSRRGFQSRYMGRQSAK